jgi:hypothetical protein
MWRRAFWHKLVDVSEDSAASGFSVDDGGGRYFQIHGVTSGSTVIFILTALRFSNLTGIFLFIITPNPAVGPIQPFPQDRAGMAYCVWSLGYGLDVQSLSPCYGQEIFLFSKTLRLSMRPNQHPIQWVLEFRPWGKAAWAWCWPLTSVKRRG